MPARVQKPWRMRDVAQMEGVSEGQADARHLKGVSFVDRLGLGMERTEREREVRTRIPCLLGSSCREYLKARILRLRRRRTRSRIPIV